MDPMIQDLKHALRALRRSPTFTLTAILALALGIGANSAIFSVIDTMLLRPVPYPEPDRVVMFLNVAPGGVGGGASPAKFNLWRQQTTVFDAVSAERFGAVNLTGVDMPEQLQRAEVSAEFFRVYGIPLTQGRAFTADEDRPNGPHVAVISDGLWRRRFGTDPQIIGKTISLSGVSHEVIGIVTPGFKTEANPPAEVWTPFQLDPNSRDQGHYFTAAGRMKPRVTLEQAKAQLAVAAEEFRKLYPGVMGPKESFTAQPMRDALIGNVARSLWVLAGAVGLVLLIACANVANLLLVRATGRRREMAIRVSMGASRAQLVRQLLTESVFLSGIGGTCGLVIGVVGIRALLAVNSASIPRIGPQASNVGLDWQLLAFTVGVTLFTGVLFGTLPALQTSRTDPSTALKESGGRVGTGFRQNKSLSLFVVTEVMLALVLLVGSALLIRSYARLRSVDPGFDAHNILTLRMSLTDPRFQRTDQVARLTRDALDRLNGLPGVAVSAATCCVPLESSFGGFGLPLIIEGRPLDGPYHSVGGWTPISRGYFEVFHIPLLRGRAFTEGDQAGSPPVVIINQALVRRLWKENGRDPLADRLIIGRGVGPAFEDPPRQIVGIVGDVRDLALNEDARPAMYVPITQVPDGVTALAARMAPLAWVVRTRVEPHSLRSAVQAQLRDVSGGLPVGTVRSMEEVVATSTAASDFNTWLLAIFGVAAVTLAAIGVYGLIAYSVQQRTHEIGVRLALGAQQRAIRNMVVFQGLRLALVGVGVGTTAALALARVMSSLLFDVSPRDPLVFVMVPLTLMIVSVVCAWVPARHAARLDPIAALRVE